MASQGGNFIRVRLHFDYPPPAVVDCRMCWLLVDLNASRVVADLESVIREKFDFSRGSILSLFIDDCYLPHTESIYVVRDNDSVRVKVDRLSHVNGGISHLDETSERSRKRQRPTEEDQPDEIGHSTEFKKKKRKKLRETSVKNVLKSDPSSTGTALEKRTKAKKEKKKKKKKDNNSSVPDKPDGPTKTKSLPLNQTVNNKKSQISKVSSSDSSSSSEEDEPPRKTAVQKSAPKTPSSTPAPSKTSKPAQKKPPPPPSSSSSDSSSDEDSSVKRPPKTKPVAPKTLKPAQKKTAPPSSSSSSVSSSDENSSVKPPPKTKPSALTTPTAGTTTNAQTLLQKEEAPPQDQTRPPSSEDEIPFIIHKPVQQPGFGVRDQSWRGRGGRGRGQSWRGDPAERRTAGGGGGATRAQSGSAEPSRNGAEVPSYETDSLTNTSVVLQNGAENGPKKDYSSMPLLAAPPKVGQRIAFKLLELTENYTPEVSEYKEGVLVSFDAVSKQIELELHNSAPAPVEPGKFDLVYQNADGTERVEYAVARDTRVTERWTSLLEPRLII